MLIKPLIICFASNPDHFRARCFDLSYLANPPSARSRLLIAAAGVALTKSSRFKRASC
jgi:hypothetical protein